jgi:hypothetical protein
LNGGGFDPGLQPDADLRGREKKARLLRASFQCIANACIAAPADAICKVRSPGRPCYLRGASIGVSRPTYLELQSRFAGRGDITHIALRAAAGCREVQ